MGTTRPRILVTGADGTMGLAVIERLVDANVDVVAGVVQPDRPTPRGATRVLLDYDRPDALASALDGIDRVFLAAGRTIARLRLSKALLDVARAKGIRYVVHLGGAGDDDTQVPHRAWPQFVERYIEWCGFRFTHLRPDTFMQAVPAFADPKPLRDGVIRHYAGETRMGWIDRDDVAAVAAACLRDPDRHHGLTYRLGSDVRSYAEIALTLTNVVGTAFRAEGRPAEEFLAAAAASGMEPLYARSVHDVLAARSAGRDMGTAASPRVLAALLGRPGKTWPQFAAEHIDAFMR